MPRLARIAPGGQVYHVINRVHDERRRIFRTTADFQAFYDALAHAMNRHPTRLLGWCVMGDHWQFVAWPREDGELSRFFGYLALTHAARWQVAHRAVGTGHVYQPRFKNFMIEQGPPLESVLRFVERAPLRARLVKSAPDWKWSSLSARLRGPAEIRELLTEPPVDLPRDWVRQVNRPQAEAEVEAIERSIQRGRPLGSDAWVQRVARRYGLQSTIRPRGRPVGWRKKK